MLSTRTTLTCDSFRFLFVFTAHSTAATQHIAFHGLSDQITAVNKYSSQLVHFASFCYYRIHFASFRHYRIHFASFRYYRTAATQLIAFHGLSDRITVVNKHSSQLVVQRVGGALNE
jgi:hypothetical protein